MGALEAVLLIWGAVMRLEFINRLAVLQDHVSQFSSSRLNRLFERGYRICSYKFMALHTVLWSRRSMEIVVWLL